MKVIKSQTGEFTRSKGKEVMEAFLKAEGKKINAVYAHNDDMALGAIQASVFGLLFTGSSIFLKGFFSPQVFINLFSENAFWGIAALGMTFVILSGGIDLSVGAMIGFSSILLSRLIMDARIHPLPAFMIIIFSGIALGTGMGCLIHFFLVVVTWYISIYTRFGRNIYALGGNEQSAILMGLPVRRVKIGVYAFSGFCASLAGIVSLYLFRQSHSRDYA
jgi:simple sugar transport system permease protein